MSLTTVLAALMRHSILLLSFIFFSSALLPGATISDNLSAARSDSETVESNTWIAAAFRTDANAYQLTTATLLLASTQSGVAQLNLYSSRNGQPADPLASFTNLSPVSATFSNVDFSEPTNYTLSPNSQYWLVLRARTGSFEWAWTESTTGSGIGFLPVWGASDDAGASWFVDSTEPQIFRLLADPVSSPVPEPSYIVFIALGTVLMILPVPALKTCKPRTQRCKP